MPTRARRRATSKASKSRGRNAARGHDHRGGRRDQQQDDNARLGKLVVVGDRGAGRRDHRRRDRSASARQRSRAVEHREDGRDDEHEKASAALTACASRRSIGRRSATLSKPEHDLHENEAQVRCWRPRARVASRTRQQAQTSRSRRSASRRPRRTVKHLDELTGVDDDVSGAARNREAREPGAARTHVCADAHRRERDEGRARQDAGYARLRCRARLLSVDRRAPALAKIVIDAKRGDECHRRAPVKDHGDRTIRQDEPSPRRAGPARRRTRDGNEGRHDEGRTRALTPGGDHDRDDERRNAKGEKPVRPLPHRAVGQARGTIARGRAASRDTSFRRR